MNRGVCTVFVSLWEEALLGIGMEQQGLSLGTLKNSCCLIVYIARR